MVEEEDEDIEDFQPLNEILKHKISRIKACSLHIWVEEDEGEMFFSIDLLKKKTMMDEERS